MRISIIILLLISFKSFSNVYQCEIDGVQTFTDKPCDKSAVQQEPVYLIPKYIKFKYGSSACEDIKLWQQAIDRINANIKKPFKYVDKHCVYLRENTVVYGFLKKEKYNDTELAKVQASNGKGYWIELPAVLPITSTLGKKPRSWYTDLRSIN